MAAKRFVKTSIDWVSFAERIPASQRPKFHLFKAKVDGYLRKLMSYPEKPPTIDFAAYRSRLPFPAMVDEFEKQYNSVKVPFPADKLTAQIDSQEKFVEGKIEEFVELSNLRCQYFEKQVNWWNEMMPFDQMTLDDYRDYFPEIAYDPINRPTFWPHDQPTAPIFPWLNKKPH